MPCSPLELSKSRKWFADAVVGLDYLHFQGVAHFDLKPDNILIGPDNTAVIADFGVSRIMKEDAHSVSGSPGTPTYTAPEAYGDVKYDPFLADVWSFGVTLHAMVFGSLPYMSQNQIELIELITAPSEWACAHTHADAEMMGLMRGMVRKDLAQRLTLTQVKEHPWVSGELAKRSGKSSYARDEWEKIEVDEEELRKAVIAGHVANFRKTPHGTLLKTTAAAEARTYKAFEAAKSPVARFLPELHDVKDSTRKRVIIEMSDLTHGVDQPCLMDIKMATRTFTEEDAASQEQRADLLAKMLKVNPDAATPAEAAAGGITKMRYLRFREGASTSATLGFRVDAVQLADGLEGVVPDSNELKSIDSVAAVNTAIRQYIQYRQPLAREFGLRLRELREALEGDDVFMSHSFVRTSVSSLLLACWALTAHLTLTFHPHLTSPLTSHLSPSPYPTPHPRPTLTSCSSSTRPSPAAAPCTSSTCRRCRRPRASSRTEGRGSRATTRTATSTASTRSYAASRSSATRPPWPRRLASPRGKRAPGASWRAGRDGTTEEALLLAPATQFAIRGRAATARLLYMMM